MDVIPENVVQAAGDNTAMLQLILLSIVFGVAMVAVGKEKSRAGENLIESLNRIILKIIGYVMKFAPLGVFALMADLVVSFAGDSDLLLALGYYALTVVIGLVFILLVCHPLIVRFFPGPSSVITCARCCRCSCWLLRRVPAQPACL